MDAALQAKLELMALEGAYTALSVDPVYENDDDEEKPRFEYDPDTITERFRFLADVIERLGIAAREGDTATVMRLARLVGEDDAAAINKLSGTPAARRAYVPTEVALVRVHRSPEGRLLRSPEGKPIQTKPEMVKLLQKVTAKKRRTRDALAFAKRWEQEVQQLQESNGVTRRVAQSMWLELETKRKLEHEKPRSDAQKYCRRQRKNLRRRVDTARKFLAQGKA